MARLTVLSGLGGKTPAAFLLELAGRRLLLDLGEGPEPGVRPDLSRAGRVDAILITHAHEDHCAALPMAAQLGYPPVWATPRTFAQMPPALRPPVQNLLPDSGTARVLGLPLTLGPAGHSPGGVWLHLATPGGGFTYTGDFSLESHGLPFVMPPPAATLLADASYGDRDDSLDDQLQAMAQAAQGGAVLPLPAAGRGADMARRLQDAGLVPMICPALAPELDIALPRVTAETARPDQVILCTGPNGESGLAAALLRRRAEGFRFIFSSHVPRGTPAHDLIASGAARWMGWNVHPRRRDIIALADATGARRVIPAFTDMAAAPNLAAALGPRLHLQTETDL